MSFVRRVPSRPSRPVVLAGVLASVFFACASKKSLDPSGFDRSCSVDTDCMLVEPVDECSSCCTSAVAVRDTPAVRAAVAEVDESCSSKSVCLAACDSAGAVCRSGTCEKATPWNTNGSEGQFGDGGAR